MFLKDWEKTSVWWFSTLGGMPLHWQVIAMEGLVDIWQTVKCFQYNGLDGNWKSGPGNGMKHFLQIV